MNMLSNAVKFTVNGRITVSAKQISACGSNAPVSPERETKREVVSADDAFRCEMKEFADGSASLVFTCPSAGGASESQHRESLNLPRSAKLPDTRAAPATTAPGI